MRNFSERQRAQVIYNTWRNANPDIVEEWERQPEEPSRLDDMRNWYVTFAAIICGVFGIAMFVAIIHYSSASDDIGFRLTFGALGVAGVIVTVVYVWYVLYKIWLD